MALDLNISGSIRPRHDLPKFGSFTCPRLQPAFGSNKQLYCTTRCSTAAQCATQHTAYFASTGGVVLLQPLLRLLRGKTGRRHPLNPRPEAVGVLLSAQAEPELVKALRAPDPVLIRIGQMLLRHSRQL